MASSSSSVCSRERREHLPLIMCPDCGEVQVETNISRVEGPNEGKRFYKCLIDGGPEKCGWFKWEDAYAAILRRRQAAALRRQNAARQQVANYGYQGQMPVVQDPPVMQAQIPVPQAPSVLLAQANTRGGPNWMTIALMVNTIVNIILTMALIGRT